MKFRKKPIVVEAEQWFPGKQVVGVSVDYRSNEAEVHTINGHWVPVLPGDWVITESDDTHYYPCTDSVFRATFEEVKE